MNSEIYTNNVSETIGYASNLVSEISLFKKIIVLNGELGAGKTQFTKGIFKGLGYENYAEINSPTFSILNTYEINGLEVHHFDLYRLDSLSEEDKSWLEEIFSDENIIIIENLKIELPKNNRQIINVYISIVDGNQRKISVNSNL